MAGERLVELIPFNTGFQFPHFHEEHLWVLAELREPEFGGEGDVVDPTHDLRLAVDHVLQFRVLAL